MLCATGLVLRSDSSTGLPAERWGRPFASLRTHETPAAHRMNRRRVRDFRRGRGSPLNRTYGDDAVRDFSTASRK
jgi:hypothetical protein